MTNHDSPEGLTTPEVARALRVSADKVRAWIRRGELGAINTGTVDRPRFVVLPRHLEAFEQARRVGPARTARRRRRTGVDFYM